MIGGKRVGRPSVKFVRGRETRAQRVKDIEKTTQPRFYESPGFSFRRLLESRLFFAQRFFPNLFEGLNGIRERIDFGLLRDF